PTLTPADTPAAPAVNTQSTEELSAEIQHIRQMVTRMMNHQSQQAKKDLPDQLFNQYLTLLEQEVTEELADEVIQNVRRGLTPEELEDRLAVQEAVSTEIASLIDFDAEAIDKPAPTDGRPLTIALIGPTGVGKTTTTAKLAATFKLHKAKRVALITLDTYRIAAVDQLQTYADIIDVPLHVAQTPEEMGLALQRCADYDVVLIDTAGRSQRDDARLEDLSAFIESARPHEVHLVLSSTSNQAVMMEAVERFTRVRIDRVIFTKLDEAVSFGVLLNVARKVNKQLSYITTGQDVPHQIEPGNPDRLAGLILGEGL
ncbi:MAG: flagellar biosynthesis protein FlhF, partial [Planctomycetota bacterium]